MDFFSVSKSRSSEPYASRVWAGITEIFCNTVIKYLIV